MFSYNVCFFKAASLATRFFTSDNSLDGVLKKSYYQPLYDITRGTKISHRLLAKP